MSAEQARTWLSKELAFSIRSSIFSSLTSLPPKAAPSRIPRIWLASASRLSRHACNLFSNLVYTASPGALLTSAAVECLVASVSDCVPLRVVSAVSNLAQTCGRAPVIIEAARTEELHMLGTILIVILVLALFGALPRWSHSKNWGYFPTGGVGLLLLVVILLLAVGRI